MRTLNIFKTLILATAVVLLLNSCGDDNNTPSGGGTTTESLTVTPTTLTLAPNASGSVNVVSNVAWTATATSGYTVTPSSGNGNATVTVKAGGGASGGTLTVKGKSKTATVTLAASSVAAEISLSTDKVELSYEAGKSATFNIICNGNWTIELPSPKPAWLLSVTPMSGSGDKTITVNTSRNNVKLKEQTFLTIKSGSKSKYITIVKDASPNEAPTKPTGLKPSGTNISTITEFSWNASTDLNGDALKYKALISKDNTTWIEIGETSAVKLLNKEEMDKNTTYYYKVIVDDSFAGGKVESDVITFTTGSTKEYWADGEVKLYEVNLDGSITEVKTTSRPFKLIYTGDGYTQELYKYGGQFDKEMDGGIKALFQVEPYRAYYQYFAVFKVAAYSNEAGMSSGSTNWDQATTKVDTKFKCSWAGGNSTGISCNTNTVVEYAARCFPELSTASALERGTKLTWSPISILINTDQYAGTNIWTSGISGVGSYGGYRMISIAQTPARHPTSSSYGDSWNTLRHEFGGHGIGLLGDEYVYQSTTAYPQSNEANFRAWQGRGAYSNIYLPEWDATLNAWKAGEMDKTPTISGENWNTFAVMPEYASASIQLYSGAATYGLGVYRSEKGSCMINNIPHFNTVSRWKIYCRIKETAGETPTVAEFLARDIDKTNTYSSAPNTKSHDHRRCEGPILMDEFHSKPYRMR